MSSQLYDHRLQEMVDLTSTGGCPYVTGQPPQHSRPHPSQVQIASPSWIDTDQRYGPVSMNRHHASMQNPLTALYADGLAWPPPSTANSNATNFISPMEYNNHLLSTAPLAMNSFGAGVDRMSEVVRADFSQPSGLGQSTAQVYPETHFCVPNIGNLRCGWEGCDYRGRFSRKSCLWRHIQDKHINPGLYQCPYCEKSFGRKDKLTSHTRAVHPQARSF